MHKYAVTIIEEMGLSTALSLLPNRQPGQDRHIWQELVEECAADMLQHENIGHDLAHDVVFAGTILAAELRRYPAIVDWDVKSYEAAVQQGVEPALAELLRNQNVLLHLPADAHSNLAKSAEDAFIEDFLLNIVGSLETVDA